MKLTERITNVVRKPVAYLGSEWERMAPRERRLVGALGGVVAIMIVLVGGYFYFGSLSELADHNADMREALAEIAKKKNVYLEAKSKVRAQEVRIGKDPPQVLGDLEIAAREASVQIPDQIERPTTPVGKYYLEHNVDIKLRQVDLPSLTKFLMKVETGQRLLMVTRLTVRRRFGGDGDKLEADATITAYERVKDTGKKGKGGGKGTGS